MDLQLFKLELWHVQNCMINDIPLSTFWFFRFWDHSKIANGFLVLSHHRYNEKFPVSECYMSNDKFSFCQTWPDSAKHGDDHINWSYSLEKNVYITSALLVYSFGKISKLIVCMKSYTWYINSLQPFADKKVIFFKSNGQRSWLLQLKEVKFKRKWKKLLETKILLYHTIMRHVHAIMFILHQQILPNLENRNYHMT